MVFCVAVFAHNATLSEETLPVTREYALIHDGGPIYPHSAFQRGIEGYVIVQFDLTEQGTTSNSIILEASPAEVFNESALKTVSEYRFLPRIVDGKRVFVQGLAYKVKFCVDEPSSLPRPDFCAQN